MPITRFRPAPHGARRRVAPLLAALFALPVAASAQVPAAAGAPVPAAAGGLAYADLADMLAAAPIVADATVARADRLKPADAPGVAAGRARFYIEADVATLIRGAGGLSTHVDLVADVPLDARGRAPKLRKRRVLLLAAPVPGRPATLRLVSPDAMLDWTPASDRAVRALATALAAADAPPRITGIANAFHVPGSLPGESETQIFLATADQRPVSLSVERHPGERPRWSVALSEIVDEAAAPPPRDTLLWYRLACFLPARLPDAATADLAPEDAAAARADYAFVLTALGPCGRTRGG